jgi:hypothetical protein
LLSSDAELLFNHPPTQNTQNTHTHTHTHTLSLSLSLSLFSQGFFLIMRKTAASSSSSSNNFFLLLMVLLVGTTQKHFAYKATKAFRVLPVIFLLMNWL